MGALRTEDGRLATTPNSIITELVSFYFPFLLYQLKQVYTSKDILTYLNNISLPELSIQNRRMLDSPITLEELQQETATFPNGKAQGDYCLQVEVYKQYGEKRLPFLLKVLNGGA